MPTALTEQPGVGISPPARPSVWRVGWAAFVGYVFTVVVGLPFAIALEEIGVDVIGSDTAGRGVFHPYDVWSWLAEGSLGLLATFVTALMVGWRLRERTGWEVPFGFTFVTLLLTGYAPLLTLTPFYWAAAPVSLVAATLVLRWRSEPAGAEPLKALGAVPRRYRRAVVIGLALAGPLMFGYVLAYGTTHPLRWTGNWGYRNSSAILNGGPLYRHDPGKVSRYQVGLITDGLFAVSDLSIVRVEGGPALQVERAGIEAHEWSVEDIDRPTPPPLHSLDGYRVSAGIRPDSITLVLRQGRVCPTGISRLDAIWVRYTVLGGRHEQRIRLEQPPGVRCP